MVPKNVGPKNISPFLFGGDLEALNPMLVRSGPGGLISEPGHGRVGDSVSFRFGSGVAGGERTTRKLNHPTALPKPPSCHPKLQPAIHIPRAPEKGRLPWKSPGWLKCNPPQKPGLWRVQGRGRFQETTMVVHMARGQNPAPSTSTNPTTRIGSLKWVVNSPTPNMGSHRF